VLQQRRTDCQHFHDVFVAASKTIQVLNVSVTIPRMIARQTERANPPANCPTEYYRRAIPLLYCAIVDLNGCYRGGILDIVSELARFIPARMICDKEDTINIDREDV